MTRERYSRGCLLLPQYARIYVYLRPLIWAHAAPAGWYIEARLGSAAGGIWEYRQWRTYRYVCQSSRRVVHGHFWITGKLWLWSY